MEDKHFRIGIQAERHMFEFLCSTTNEAYDAINDAYITFNLRIDMDRVMEILVDMSRDKGIRYSTHQLVIAIADGEV